MYDNKQCSYCVDYQSLYEIAYGYGKFTENFKLFGTFPRRHIPHCIVLSELEVVTPTNLVVEVSEFASINFLFNMVRS